MLVYDSFACSRRCARSAINPWSSAVARQLIDRVPGGVLRQPGVGAQRHQSEETGGDHPRVRHPVGVGEHADLLEVGDPVQVDLLGELPGRGSVDVLVGEHQTTWQRPLAGGRLAGPLPQQNLQAHPSRRVRPDCENGHQDLHVSVLKMTGR